MNELFWLLSGIFGFSLLVVLFVHLKKRAVLARALAVEIAGLLSEAGELRLYLSQEGHDWLKSGQVLTESPLHLRLKTPVLRVSIGELYRLPGMVVRKVLCFYSAFNNIQRLIEILFARILQQEQSRLPLTEKAVKLTRIRIRRILQGLELMGRIVGLTAQTLKNLPDSYELPTAKTFEPDIGGVITQN